MPIQPYSTGGGQLRSFFQYLQYYGIQDFILPFLLIFSVLFGILHNVKLFRKPKLGADGQPVTETVGTGNNERTVPVYLADKKLNGVLAMVISLAITIPHAVGAYPPNRDPIVFISSFLPHTVIVLISVLLMLLLLGLTGATIPNALTWLIAVIGAVILGFVFLTTAFKDFMPALTGLRNPAFQALIIVVLVIGLVGYFVIKPEGPVDPSDKGLPGTLKKWVGTRRMP